MLFSYHLLYFCTALSLIIMLSSHYHHHKSKTFSQLTQCPFTGTLLLFVYTGALVPWIISVNNFRFSNNISETMLPIDMYNISLERSFYSASDRVSCIKIHAEMKALLQVKVLSFYIHWCVWFLTAYSHSLIKYSYYFTHKSYKMVDNKSKTPLIRHIRKKYITHED